MNFSAVAIRLTVFFYWFYTKVCRTMLFSAVIMLLIFILALWLLRREGLLKGSAGAAVCVLLTLGALILRLYLFDHRSDDFLSFLLPWTEFFRENGGFKALGIPVGNYNPPYLYFLALFSYLDIDELYLIKLLSVLFDVLLAWAALKLSSLLTQSRAKLLLCFFAVLYLPTVVLNGAYWGQCDSIYCFFGLFAVYLALTERPVGSMFSLAASLAFKLQAVFIMPVFFIMLIARRIKFRELFIFPAAYILYMLPAVIAGRPFWDTLTLYVSQAGTVGDAMNYNAPSFTSMFAWNGDTALCSRLLILAAFAAVILIYIDAIRRRDELSDKSIFAYAVLLCLVIPYLLPHMHDRYFFAAGVLLVVLAVSDLRFFAVPVFAELASLHCYYAYFAQHYLVRPALGGLLMLAALASVLVYLSLTFKKGKKYEISP